MLPFDPDTLPIAVVGRPHGIAGEVTVRLFDPASSTLDDFSLPFSLWIDAAGPPGRRRCVVQSFRRAADKCLIGFQGIADRDAASRLTGATVRVDRSELPPLTAGEYYLEDLPGCTAFDREGRTVGVVAAVYWNGAHHVLSIRGANAAEILVPVARGHVIAVDAPARRITIEEVDDDDAGQGAP